MTKPFNGPAPIYVFVTVNPYRGCGFDKPFTARVGACKTEAEVADVIADDLKKMRNTFGGLIEATSTKTRVYRAFRAEWTELALT